MNSLVYLHYLLSTSNYAQVFVSCSWCFWRWPCYWVSRFTWMWSSNIYWNLQKTRRSVREMEQVHPNFIGKLIYNFHVHVLFRCWLASRGPPRLSSSKTAGVRCGYWCRRQKKHLTRYLQKHSLRHCTHRNVPNRCLGRWLMYMSWWQCLPKFTQFINYSSSAIFHLSSFFSSMHQKPKNVLCRQFVL